MRKGSLVKLLMAVMVICLTISALTACTGDQTVKAQFIVNNSVYHTVAIDGQTEIDLPGDPEKVGYVFDGWYLDNGTYQKAFAGDVSGIKSNVNILIYAKWKVCEHDFSDWVLTTAPTCEKAGVETQTCAICKLSETREVSALGHIEVIDEAKEATCEESGLTEGKHCERCGETLVKQKVVKAHGHTEVIDEKLAPTCEDAGLTRGKHCLVCNKVLVAQKTIPALGHSYKLDTEKGVKGYTWTFGETVTCTAHGVCKNDEAHLITVKATVIEVEVTQKQTCENPEQTTYTATFDVDWATKQTIVKDTKDALGHDLVHVPEKLPTETEAGYAAYDYCTRCDYSTKVDIGKGHTNWKKVPAQAATCEESGWHEYWVCMDEGCGVSTFNKYTAIPALGHSYELDTTKGVNGYSWNENHTACTAYGVCTRQGCAHTTTIEATVEAKVTQKQSCVNPEETTYTATFAEDWAKQQVVVKETKPALGHSYGETTYSWNGVTACTATHSCIRTGCAHKESVNATAITSDVTQEQSCVNPELTKYTATFSVNWAETQVKANVQTNPAKGHTEVVDKAKAPTCTETGLTEGKHCSVCNEVLVAQQIVKANGHTEVVDKAKAPTCTETGLTEGKHCSVCNEVLVAQTVVPAKGHTEATDEAKAPTCTETGLTEGKHCSVCNEVLVAQTVIPAKGHTYDQEVATEAYLKSVATCENNAVYYKSCACGHSSKGTKDEATFEDKNTKKGHCYAKEDASDKYLASVATCTEPAKYYYSCERCGATGQATFENGTALGHDYGEWVSNGDGTHTKTCKNDSKHTVTEDCHGGEATCKDKATCDDCHKTYGDLSKHTLTKIDANPVSCTENGNIEYYYCDTCGKYFSDAQGATEITKEATVIEAKGHDYTDELAYAEYLKTAVTCTSPAVYYKSCKHCKESSEGTKGEATFEFGTSLGHNYGEVTYTGTKDENGDYTSYTASHTCTRQGCDHTESVTTTQVYVTETYKATCTEYSYNEYVAYFEVKWAGVSDGDGSSQYNFTEVTGNTYRHDVDSKTVQYAYGKDENGEYVIATATCQNQNCQKHLEAKTYDLGSRNVEEATCKIPEMTEFGPLNFGTESYWTIGGYYKLETAPKLEHTVGSAYTEDNWNDETPATCMSTGAVGYYECPHCLDLFDKKGNKIEDLTIPAKGHDYKVDVTKGENGYAVQKFDEEDCLIAYCVCQREGCTAAIPDYESSIRTNNYKQIASKAATCTEAGSVTYEATFNSIDGAWIGDNGKVTVTFTIPAKGHTLQHTAAKDATCTEAGNNEYWTCGTCNKLFSDKDGKTEITLEDTVIAAKGHTLVHTAAKGATCTEAGNNEYWTCGTCDKLFSDKDGKTEITLQDTVIAAKGHNYGEVTYNYAEGNGNDTCTATGTCSNCGDTQTATATNATLNSQPATCTQVEVVTYKAQFRNVDWITVGVDGKNKDVNGYVVVKIVNGTCRHHNVDNVTYTYETDNEGNPYLKATATCNNEECKQTLTATAYSWSKKSISQPADCQKEEKTQFNGVVWTFAKDGQDIEDRFDVNENPFDILTAPKLTHGKDNESCSWNNGQAATCMAEGIKAHYYCSVCTKYYDADGNKIGDNLDDLKTHALGHSYALDKSKGVNGYEFDEESNCGIIYLVCVREGCSADANDHYYKLLSDTYDKGEETATCTADGSVTYTFTFNKLADSNVWNDKINNWIETNLTSIGDDKYTVEVTFTILATGHTYDQDKVDDKYLKSAATCTSPAGYYKSCACGASSEGTENAPTFTDGDVDPANHVDENTDYVCDLCGKITVETKTLAEFLALEDSTTAYYVIEGYVYKINNDTYGNLYINDGTENLYVYGIKKAFNTQGELEDKDFSDLGVVVGKYVKLIAYKTTYKGTKEAMDSRLVEALDATDAQIVAAAKFNFEGVDTTNSYTQDFTLPTTVDDAFSGVTVTWGVQTETALVTISQAEGVYTASVKLPAADTVVTLIATITKGEASATKSFDVTLAACAHTLVDKYDDDGHWQECACGTNTTTKEAHSFTTKCDGSDHWQECVCGYKTAAEEHSYGTLVAQKDATCTEKGRKAYYYCSVCESYFDSEKNLTTWDDLEIALASHTDTDGDGKCNVCAKFVKEQAVATFEFGENGEANHTDGKEVTEYTETDKGYTLTFDSLSKVFADARDAKGNGCLKVGIKSTAGSFSFTVPDGVTKVIIYIAGYKTNAVSVIINGEDVHDIDDKLSDNGEYYPIEVNTSKDKTVTVSTSTSNKKYSMLNKVEYYALVEDTTTDKDRVESVINSITVPDNSNKLEGYTFTTESNGVTITWQSSNDSVLKVNDDGTYEPHAQESKTTVTLTATFTLNDVTVKKTYDMLVPGTACTHETKTKHDAITSTCLVKGNSEYYTCDVCGKYFTNEACTSELTDNNNDGKVDADDALIDLGAHSYKSHFCEVCGAPENGEYYYRLQQKGITGEPTLYILPTHTDTSGAKAYRFLNTTEDVTVADVAKITVSVIKDDTLGCYKYTLLIAEKYITIGNNSSNKVAILLEESPGDTYWVWDNENQLMTYTFNSTVYALGTYDTYSTVMAVESQYFNDNYLCQFVYACSTHSFDGGVVTKAATCCTEGLKTYTCSVCGGTYVEPISPTNAHDYSQDWSSDANKHYYACMTDGCEATTDEAEHTDDDGDGFCNICGYDMNAAAVTTQEYTLDFSTKDNRTECSTSKQVWEQNGIKLTNVKGEATSNVADYSNPARFYKNSTITIEKPGMTKIVFVTSEKTYTTALQNSLSGDNITVTSTDDTTITLEFTTAVDSYTIKLTTGATRLKSLTVTATESSSGGGDEGEGGTTTEKTYSISADKNNENSDVLFEQGGTYSNVELSELEAGATVKFGVKPTDGYKIKSVKVGENEAKTDDGTTSPDENGYYYYSYTIQENDATELTVTVEVEVDTSTPATKYTVTVSAENATVKYHNGTDYVALEANNTFQTAGQFKLQVEAVTGYTVQSVKLGETVLTKVEGEDNVYSGSTDTDNVTVTVTATKDASGETGGESGETNESVTKTITIADYASANGWGSSKQNKELVVDDVLTITVDGTQNTGKYYNNSEWRLYQSDNGSITVAAAEGYSIVSVKFTYVSSNKGVLLNDTTQVLSNDVVAVNAQSIKLSVGNTDTKTNGQARVTAIEVEYVKNA